MMSVIPPDRNEVFYAWLASAMIPSEVFLSVSDAFRDFSGFHASFMNHEDQAVSMIPQRCHRTLQANGTSRSLEKVQAVLEKLGIGVFSIADPVYPQMLKQIPDPPAVLFYLGNLKCLGTRTLAVVGSRSASYSGLQATRKITRELSRKGVTIVSGMACGIDAAAHWGCLEGSSPTIAVMGCGLDIVYPSDNARLRDAILGGGGLLLSEFVPGEKPLGWHFPLRNRIITGISSALILMEAKIRSGSLTSVRHALDQGKDVFVYPGDPSSGYYEGNHQLLREGARYFTGSEDILEDMAWLDNQTIIGHNIDCSATVPADSPAEEAVLQALKPGTLSFEQLSGLTGLSPSELMSSITMLQVRGMIETLPGKFYRIKG